MIDRIKWSKDLIDKAILEHRPYAIIVGLTTGGDSLVAFHVAKMLCTVDACFTCDTTIAAHETIKNCQDVCEKYKTKWICKAPPYGGLQENNNTYFELVRQHGFPGKTKTTHNWMYRYLKDHTVAKIVSSFKQGKRRPIIIISGARKHESVRRFGTSKDITVNKGTIWVNILNEWTDSDMQEFKTDNRIDDERSPISKIMGISGECFCGCFAQKNELMELKCASRDTYNKIVGIQKWLTENTKMKWGWEDSPPASWIQEQKGQLNMFSPEMLFCSTCMNNSVVS